MHAPNEDALLARADAAIEMAKRLGMERDRHIAVGHLLSATQFPATPDNPNSSSPHYLFLAIRLFYDRMQARNTLH
jgi:hypothetical protein